MVLSGRSAAARLIELANREELIALDVVVRATGVDRRTLLRDWKRRGHPVTHIGRLIKLSAPLVVASYFPHTAIPATGRTS